MKAIVWCRNSYQRSSTSIAIIVFDTSTSFVRLICEMKVKQPSRYAEFQNIMLWFHVPKFQVNPCAYLDICYKTDRLLETANYFRRLNRGSYLVSRHRMQSSKCHEYSARLYLWKPFLRDMINWADSFVIYTGIRRKIRNKCIMLLMRYKAIRLSLPSVPDVLAMPWGWEMALCLSSCIYSSFSRTPGTPTLIM